MKGMNVWHLSHRLIDHLKMTTLDDCENASQITCNIFYWLDIQVREVCTTEHAKSINGHIQQMNCTRLWRIYRNTPEAPLTKRSTPPTNVSSYWAARMCCNELTESLPEELYGNQVILITIVTAAFESHAEALELHITHCLSINGKWIVLLPLPTHMLTKTGRSSSLRIIIAKNLFWKGSFTTTLYLLQTNVNA